MMFEMFRASLWESDEEEKARKRREGGEGERQRKEHEGEPQMDFRRTMMQKERGSGCKI